MPGGAVPAGEVAVHDLEPNPLGPITADHSFMVLEGVDGLKDAVGGAGPGRDSRVRAVEGH